MEHLKVLKSGIRSGEVLATSLWSKQFGISEVSIWDRIRLGVVIAAIVTRVDEEITENEIVDAAVAEVAESDSFIVDVMFGIELEDIVTQLRNASESDRVSAELNALASALLEPIATSLGVGGVDEESWKAVEACARDIGGGAAVASIFYRAAKKSVDSRGS